MRTLAGITPEERANCRGMWGDHTFWGLVIISIYIKLIEKRPEATCTTHKN